MNFKLTRTRALLPAAFGTLLIASAQPPAVPPDVAAQLVQRLPTDWQAVAAQHRIFSDFYKYLLKDDDDDLRFETLNLLASKPGAEEFVAAHLLAELLAKGPAKYRSRILYEIAYGNNWTGNALTIPLLEREATGNPDPIIALAALDSLHLVEGRRLRAVVEQRLRQISWDYKNHKEEVDSLDAEHQKLMYIENRIDLPEFMRSPPALFQVPAKGSSIRVAMMGDFGTRGEDQRKVAAAMLAESKQKPFDFGLTLGDNFYFELNGPDDPALNTAFEDLYGPLNITFYPVLGNHDWYGAMPETEILYSSKNRHWHMPAPYYTYSAGHVQFFAINTQFGADGEQHLFSSLQARWLQSELEKSTAKWKVVYGHLPPYTSLWSSYVLAGDLLPILKGRADVYIAGHVHNLEQHKPENGVNLFIIGSSGRGQVAVDASDPETVFAKEAYGFGILEADDHALSIHIIGEDGKEMHVATFHK